MKKGVTFLFLKLNLGKHQKCSYCAVTTRPGIGGTESDDYCGGFLVQRQETGMSFSRCKQQFKTTVTGQMRGIVVMMVFFVPLKEER